MLRSPPSHLLPESGRSSGKRPASPGVTGGGTSFGRKRVGSSRSPSGPEQGGTPPPPTKKGPEKHPKKKNPPRRIRGPVGFPGAERRLATGYAGGLNRPAVHCGR